MATDQKEKNEFVRFLIKTDNIVWNDDKNVIIKFQHNQTFIYPKVFTLKQNVNLETDRLFTNADYQDKTAKYLQISFPKTPKPYVDKKGNTHIFNKVIIRTKQEGQLDKNGKQVYLEKELSLWDLKKHFVEETKLILNEVKTAKENPQSNNQNNPQTLIQN